MPEIEPQYFKEFRKHIDKTFATKADLKNFATKVNLKTDLELLVVRFEQHTTDLKTGFSESLKGIGDYVKSIDEKVTRLEGRVVELDSKFCNFDFKVTNMENNIFFLKEAIKRVPSEKDTQDLKKRIIRLEARFA